MEVSEHADHRQEEGDSSFAYLLHNVIRCKLNCLKSSFDQSMVYTVLHEIIFVGIRKQAPACMQ